MKSWNCYYTNYTRIGLDVIQKAWFFVKELYFGRGEVCFMQTLHTLTGAVSCGHTLVHSTI